MQITSSELSGRSYRGALHVHTTCSDGKLSPLESCRRYRRLGFDFVFITDHDQWNDQSHLCDGEFKVFSALELSCRGGREHVVALGVHEWDGRKDTQEAIHWVNGLGGVPILCHPFWSRLSLRRALELEGYPLLEVWNTHGGLKFPGSPPIFGISFSRRDGVCMVWPPTIPMPPDPAEAASSRFGLRNSAKELF